MNIKQAAHFSLITLSHQIKLAISDDGKKNFMNPTFLTSDFDELESVLKEKFPSIVFRYLPNPVEKIFSDGDSVNKYTN